MLIEPGVELRLVNAGALAAILSYEQARMTLAGAAVLTPAMRDSALIFTEARAQSALAGLQARWLVWSDAVEAPKSAGAGMRHISLRTVERARFICDGQRFTFAAG
jgi:hypothetical protein